MRLNKVSDISFSNDTVRLFTCVNLNNVVTSQACCRELIKQPLVGKLISKYVYAIQFTVRTFILKLFESSFKINLLIFHISNEITTTVFGVWENNSHKVKQLNTLFSLDSFKLSRQ